MTTYDAVIMRTIIDLPEPLLYQLDQLGSAARRSRASMVREAVVAYVAERQLPPPEDAFGRWRGRGGDGLAYQEALRSEWERDAR
jgi:hypothetical protein